MNSTAYQNEDYTDFRRILRDSAKLVLARLCPFFASLLKADLPCFISVAISTVIIFKHHYFDLMFEN